MAQFFDYPLNYGPGRTACPKYTDNDYNTYEDGTECIFNISPTGSSDPDQNPVLIESTRQFTHIFIKAEGLSLIHI